MKEIHINCDLGERGMNDEELMPLISACNIACGGHAGTVESMRKTVDLALKNSVEIGAHPSYPDKENFGRKKIKIPSEELKRSLLAQIISLKEIAEAEGATINHIKAHGALYNETAKDEKIAALLVEVLEEFDEEIALYVPQNSIISKMAAGKIKTVYEAFADRNYNPDYSLVSRENPNALLTEKESVFSHLDQMFSKEEIKCYSGETISSKAQTFCLHGDTPNALKILQFLKEKFAQQHIKIKHT